MKISDDAFCVCDSIVRNWKARKGEWLTLRTDWGDERREFLPVIVAGKDYWADKITGSLYRLDGTSPSGGRMRIEVEVFA